jgi:hypothetical protein
VFPDGRKTLIESLVPDIHDLREAEWCEKVKPSQKDRQVIEKRVAALSAL